MRIGMVTACYRPVINGVTHMIDLYRSELQARGHEVTIFTLGSSLQSDDENGVVRSPGIPLGTTGYHIGLRYTKKAQHMLEQMDIIHCHHLFMSLELAKRYGNCPIVYTNHTRYDLYLSHYSRLPQTVCDKFMLEMWPRITDYCDVVIAPSDSIKEVMQKFGVNRPVIVIENGVNLAQFHQAKTPGMRSQLGLPEDAVVGIYTGRMSTEKNVMVLVDEMASAQSKCSQLQFLLVGGGPLFDDIKRRINQLELENIIHLVGGVPYQEIPRFLSAADFFTTASISEVHPLSVIESAASGLPVVAYDSPGINDIVENGNSGLLVEQAPRKLASAMIELAQDEELRKRLGQGAELAANRFDISSNVDSTLSLYEDLVANQLSDRLVKTPPVSTIDRRSIVSKNQSKRRNTTPEYDH